MRILKPCLDARGTPAHASAHQHHAQVGCLTIAQGDMSCQALGQPLLGLILQRLVKRPICCGEMHLVTARVLRARLARPLEATILGDHHKRRQQLARRRRRLLPRHLAPRTAHHTHQRANHTNDRAHDSSFPRSHRQAHTARIRVCATSRKQGLWLALPCVHRIRHPRMALRNRPCSHAITDGTRDRLRNSALACALQWS